MKINQLFTRSIPLHIIQQLLEAFSLNGLEDSKTFTLLDLEKQHTVDKVQALRSTLLEYYLPCKAELYLKCITARSCIMILRQTVRLHQYVLRSDQTYIIHKKITRYHIESIFTDVNKYTFKQTLVKLVF